MKRLLPAPLEVLLTPAAAQGLRVHAATRPTQEQPPLPGLREFVSWPTCQPRSPKSQDTHADTHWRPPLCPGPTGGPGRRAGSVHSPCPWCCVGIGRPAGPSHWGHTRWRARCICTSEKNMEDGGLETGWAPAEEGLVSHQEAPALSEPDAVALLWSSIEHLLCARAAVTEPTTRGCSGL